MTIPNPTLDDVTFNELVNNARKNIAVLSKQWTNYNESDPGITLLELLCWLVDNQTYSLNRITKKNYRKFLKLLGVQPKIRNPAKFNVSFICKGKGTVAIPEKTTLVNSPSLALLDDKDGNEEYITLETEKKLDVIPAVLKNISVISNFGISDKTEFLSKKPISCFGNTPRINNTFLLGLDTKHNKKATLNIFFELEHDKLDMYPFGVHCSDDNKFFLSSELEWRYSQKGTSVHNWPLLKVLTDDTNSLTKDGIVSLEIPFDKVSADDIHKTNNNSLRWISCTLKDGSFEIPPKIKSIHLNSVLATQHHTTTEIIEKSNGWPNQHFALSNRPIFDVLQVHVSTNHDDDSSEEMTEWKRVDDFDTSGPDDLQYIVDYDNGSIMFGNGFHGDIPPVDSKIMVSYTYGTANDEYLDNTKDSITLKISSDKKYSSIKNINAKLITKSSHGETIQEAMTRARKETQTPFKAVTGYDYEYIAKNTPGLRVARVFAIPDEQNNEMVIVAVPYSSLPNPLPSKGFLQTLSAHIEKHRPITTKTSVVSPNYIEISISANVTIDKRANEKTIKENILSALNSFLNPIGENEKEEGWKIGRPVYRSELYAIIKEVKGVIHVSPPYITASGQNNTFGYTNDMIWIDKFSLVYPGIHSVIVKYEHSKDTMIEEDHNNDG